MSLSLGYSPCPNDTFIFYALAHGKASLDEPLEIILDDVEALNQRAKRGALDVTKISYHAYGHLSEDYVMLRSGGALGEGVGPLIVSKERLRTLSKRRVAIPGGLTTANLLLRLSQPDDLELIELRYDQIMPAVADGSVDAGLIIHESRFTYSHYGLQKYLDLGEWWEQETGLLLPLGGIIAKRALGDARLAKLNEAIRASLRYAYAHPEACESYIAAHAQEMSPEVRQRHIELYVNEYSDDLGLAGMHAVKALFNMARLRELLPPIHSPLFFPD